MESSSVDRSSFCIMPWVHFHVDTGGKVKACCTTSITYGSLVEEPTLKNLEDIWNDKSIRNFRIKQLKGFKDKRCNGCYKRELAGKSSMRTETLDKYEKVLPSFVKNTSIDGVVENKPSYLDIRFSNVCNLKCRTCWHGASSSWFEEAKILQNQVSEQAIIKATINNRQLIKELLVFSDDLQEVYFAGGEPLMMGEHYDMLALLLAERQTKTHLRYNTNLSLLKYKNLTVTSLWSRFENITLSISVDGMGKEGEYIRKGLKWDQLLENIKKVKSECPHIKLEIAPTISVFNILSLGKLHQFFVNEKLIEINGVYLNLLDRPTYYNVMSLSIGEKKKAKDQIDEHIFWLKSNSANHKVIREFESLTSYLFKADLSNHQIEFEKQTKLLDNIRSENYHEVFADKLE